VFVGKLAGLDQVLNFILSDAEERVYSMDAGVVVHQLGVYFIRGDAIAAMGGFEESEE
jgi:small nuclear ribonucleoprotein (snRNP)-like protein